MVKPTKGDYNILIFKTPTSCNGCPFLDEYNEYCKADRRHLDKMIKNERPPFCPLKEIYSDPGIVIPEGMCMYPVYDPGNCFNCPINDPWNHCCKVTHTVYTYEQLHGETRLPDCPMQDLYRDPKSGYFRML